MSERYPVIQIRTAEGQLQVRDGLILCFFMRRQHTEIAQAVWRSLQTFVRAIPPSALGWYVDPDGDCRRPPKSAGI